MSAFRAVASSRRPSVFHPNRPSAGGSAARQASASSSLVSLSSAASAASAASAPSCSSRRSSAKKYPGARQRGWLRFGSRWDTCEAAEGIHRDQPEDRLQWLNRFLAGCELEDRSSKPRSNPCSVSPRLEEQSVKARKERPRWDEARHSPRANRVRQAATERSARANAPHPEASDRDGA
jgi:hypothetical protein